MKSNIRTLKVHTLNKNLLASACIDLAAKVIHARCDEFKPDILIGIRSGGYVVGEAMMSSFPKATLFSITCRRPSTEMKKNSSILKKLLRKLPSSITNRLRIIEHIVLTQLSSRKKKTEFTTNNSELTVIKDFLQQHSPNPNILIVDDAVDSGGTLASVVEMVKDISVPGSTIKTAVITVTTVNPFIEPDFLLYRYVLCRFPWSFDFKN